jgi:DNA-binding NtrC family response regulator
MSQIKVLLVDDEPDFMEPLTNRLTLRKLEVYNAGSGHEALALLEGQAVDVVVLDVKMPGMSGLEVIRELKQRHPLVEVIMLTGHANLEASIQGMEAGAFDYLLKPAQIDELVYKIQDASQKKTLQEKKIAALRQEAGAS